MFCLTASIYGCIDSVTSSTKTISTGRPCPTPRKYRILPGLPSSRISTLSLVRLPTGCPLWSVSPKSISTPPSESKWARPGLPIVTWSEAKAGAAPSIISSAIRDTAANAAPLYRNTAFICTMILLSATPYSQEASLAAAPRQPRKLACLHHAVRLSQNADVNSSGLCVASETIKFAMGRADAARSGVGDFGLGDAVRRSSPGRSRTQAKRYRRGRLHHLQPYHSGGYRSRT